MTNREPTLAINNIPGLNNWEMAALQVLYVLGRAEPEGFVPLARELRQAREQRALDVGRLRALDKRGVQIRDYSTADLKRIARGDVEYLMGRWADQGMTDEEIAAMIPRAREVAARASFKLALHDGLRHYRRINAEATPHVVARLIDEGWAVEAVLEQDNSTYPMVFAIGTEQFGLHTAYTPGIPDLATYRLSTLHGVLGWMAFR